MKEGRYAIVEEIEIDGFRFGIRCISAMEAFHHEIAEKNVWMPKVSKAEDGTIDIEDQTESRKEFLATSVKWLRLGIVYGIRPDEIGHVVVVLEIGTDALEQIP